VKPTAPVWLDGEPAEPRPPLAGDTSAEVCVVGGGIGGIATAWHLAERGVRALVVEARAVGSGATGRNGGFFIAGAAPMYDEARRRFGRERAARVHRATLAGQAAMLAVAEEVGAREHFRLVGMLRLGVDAAEAAAVRAHHAALREDGLPGELVAEADLPPAVRRPGRIGLLTPGDGAVHPVRWLRALARAVEARGARVVEGTRVVEPPSVDGGSGVLVRTDRGRVTADRAVVAVDGGLAALVPAARRVRARRLNMVATAPAPPVLPCPVYARDGHEYAQQLPDGRVALGGFSDLDGPASWTAREEVAPRVQARLDAYLREELGVAAPVTHRWAGVVGYADDPLPTCGPAPGTGGRIVALGGYHGTGHVQAFVAARIAAELIADGDSADRDLYAPVG
jgi:glycine/D-amino acid oxidase-like deaminating enzyme